MTELRTERLILRRARPGDLEAMHAVLSDERAMQYWSEGPHADIERTKEWLDSMVDAAPEQSDDFVITLDGEVIGKLGTWRIPDIGFIILSEHWGRGYAAEAMRAFLTHIFESRGVELLTADVDPRNTGSLRLLKDHGFVETGYAKANWNTHIGACDSIFLELKRELWLSAG
jgi:[ribosomal protein S5]-alanine N-acetyltransferase